MDVVKNSLVDQLYSVLKDAIVKGEMQPGDRIVELEVAKKYGVSQGTVREALSELSKEGLVISHRYKGRFVANFSKRTINEVYSFREILEVFAIKRATERLTDQGLKKMQHYYDEMYEAGRANDLARTRVADVSFHTQIYLMADHEFMYEVWENLSTKANRVWYLTNQVYFANLTGVAAIHKPMLEALIKGDAEACVKAFHKHLNFVRKELQKGFQEMP